MATVLYARRLLLLRSRRHRHRILMVNFRLPMSFQDRHNDNYALMHAPPPALHWLTGLHTTSLIVFPNADHAPIAAQHNNYSH